jgi:hypothetical protein
MLLTISTYLHYQYLLKLTHIRPEFYTGNLDLGQLLQSY